MQELSAVVKSGVPVYFMAGNRDFLVGERFAAQTGLRILTDPTVVDLYGTPTLLMHGDSLCTRDGELPKISTQNTQAMDAKYTQTASL